MVKIQIYTTFTPHVVKTQIYMTFTPHVVKICIYTAFLPHMVKIQIYMTFSPHGENSDLQDIFCGENSDLHDTSTTCGKYKVVKVSPDGSLGSKLGSEMGAS